MDIIVSTLIVLCVLYLSLYYFELNVNNNERNKTIIEGFDSKKPEHFNLASDYIKKTNDFTICLNNNNKQVHCDTCFINPNLSIREARSNFEIKPVILNNKEIEVDERLLKKMERQLLKKTNDF